MVIAAVSSSLFSAEPEAIPERFPMLAILALACTRGPSGVCSTDIRAARAAWCQLPDTWHECIIPAGTTINSSTAVVVYS